MQSLVHERFLPSLQNPVLAELADAAVLPWEAGELVFTTDSYVVSPLEFPGGDIGRLAVAGTVNDLAVMGATPVALSLGLIIEEGLPFEVLDRVIASLAATAHEAGVTVVTGDTKTIERRSASVSAEATPRADTRSGLFINTAGVGRRIHGARPDMRRVRPGDVTLVNGNLAEHGLAVLSCRHGISFETSLRSDVAPLNGLIARVLATGADVKFMRDATRGGVAGVLTDISVQAGVSLEIDDAALPITPTAQHAAELLGLDPLTIANEGNVVFVVAEDDVDTILDVMRADEHGRSAARIGRVTDSAPPLVELLTRGGGRRIVQRPYGEDLPRIC